jgi:hypothetical protein
MFRTLIAIGLIAASGCAVAQAPPSAIRLEPLEAGASGARMTTVHNYYGRCGPAVIQVLGVANDNGDFYSVDAAGRHATVVAIGPGGGPTLDLGGALSDYNGVACVGDGANRHLLLWSACGGSACDDGYNFTVVDVRALRILAGGDAPCDAACARRLTGSPLPEQLDRSR